MIYTAITSKEVCDCFNKLCADYGISVYENMSGKNYSNGLYKTKVWKLWRVIYSLRDASMGVGRFHIRWKKYTPIIYYCLLMFLRSCLKWEFDKLKFKKFVMGKVKWLVHLQQE